MVALLETYQEETGGVTIPDALRDRMGLERLAP
jgi:seryl-tRNA synthetase